MRMDSGEREKRFENVDQKLFADPAERQTCKRDAKLRRGKVGVEMSPDVFCKTRTHVPLLCQRVQLARTHFDDGKLTRDEEPVKGHERGNHSQFSDENSWRIPMSHKRVGNWNRYHKRGKK